MIQILIVDSHPIVRAGLELYLNSKPDLKVVGSLGSGIEIFDFIRKQKVDVIISFSSRMRLKNDLSTDL